MGTNYFKTAWRHLLRNPRTSIINISGLSLGITCALLIAIYIQHELSFDRFHADAPRIFQVILNSSNDGRETWGGNTPPPVGAAFASNIPEIESYTRVYKPQDVVIRAVRSDTEI